MLNSFRMLGARYAIEAYQFGIPVINYDIDDKSWLKIQWSILQSS